MKKVRILRDYADFKKGSEVDVQQNVADFLLINGIACIVPEPCGDGCDDCEDCKGKKAKAKPAKTKTKNTPSK